MGEAQLFQPLFSEIHHADGTFRTSGYSWLTSDWTGERWNVCDPHNQDLQTETINFNVPAMPDKTFLDLPEIVEDIRRTIAVATELRTSLKGQGPYCNSRSSIRRFAQCLLRIYREIFDMGLESPLEMNEGQLSELRDRLLYSEHISRAYSEKLLEKIEDLGLDSVPVSIRRDKKKACVVDQARLQRMLGISDFRTCGDCLKIINDLAQELAVLHPEYRWEKPKTFKKDKVASEVQARNHAWALNLFFAASNLTKKDFELPLHLDPFPGSKKEATYFVTNSFSKKGIPARPCRGRTRNMPVPVFLTLMDACVRWVLDYAEPLFDLEEQVVAKFSEIASNRGEDTARRIANAFVRELSSEFEWVGKLASPFPLGSFRHNRSANNSKYDDEFICEVQKMLDEGLTAAAVGKRLGISKDSVHFIKRRFIEDAHFHNLPTTGVSLNYALYSYLPFACSVILLAFTAGRESSIQELRYGCTKRIAGLRYINLYIPKTLRRYEDLPTVELVEEAVAVIERLSKSARHKTGSNRLFQFDDLVGNRVKGIRFDDVYRNFFELIDMPTDEDGSYWKLSEHQFRRFFAIMYFYRYGRDKGGNFEALMYHLRHCDWTMTDRYLTETERGAIFREVEEEWLAHVIIDGKPVDRSLQNLLSSVDKVKSSVLNNTKIVREKEAERELKRFVHNEGLVFEFLPIGAVCLGLSPGRAKIAKCAIEVDGEFAVCVHKASKSLCNGCSNYVECDSLVSSQTPEKQPLTPLVCNSPLLDAVLLDAEVENV